MAQHDGGGQKRLRRSRLFGGLVHAEKAERNAAKDHQPYQRPKAREVIDPYDDPARPTLPMNDR